MRFQIESVWADGKRVFLSDSQISEWTDNTFTMVVGQNAAGKSRLLRKIVSTYVFARQDISYSEALTSHFISSPEESLRYTATLNEHLKASYKTQDYLKSLPNPSESYNLPRQRPSREVAETSSLYFVPQKFGQSINNHNDDDVQLSTGSAVCPTHVIAVSTGRHDRFPSSSQSKKKPSGVKYSYIGSDRPNGSSVPNSLSSLIDGVMKGQQNAYRLSKIFEYLGFAPYLDIKIALDAKQFNKLSDAEKSELHFNCNPEIIDFLSDEFSYLPYDDHQYKFYDTLKRQKKSHLEVYLWDIDTGIGGNLLRELSTFLKVGIIKIYDITLLKNSNKSRLRLSQASSGQQCMLTMMLGIAGSIQNGSLICIDEPEISLHPQWQSSLVKQLQEVFADFRGCHFVIATHSPQLVSGLVTDNGYVLGLEEGRLYKPYEYAKRSADFQLAEIFQSPGQNNEYLLRTVLILLTKIAKREDFNQDDREAAKKLFQIQLKMSNTDPVYHLISQLGALYL